jgi:histidinol-phosphate/aromatic aminotransferase/cobyric acid decarboxylase-like protein
MKRNVRVRAYDNDAIRNYIRVSVGTLDEMQATVNVLQDLLKT